MGDTLWRSSGRSGRLGELVEAFTVGNDHLVDRHILTDDCWGSIAHAAALHRAGILSADELAGVQRALLGLIERHGSEGVAIERGQEDCHTAIEQHLVERLGDLGKKIHTGRSRNDQVLTALRLFTRRRLLDISIAVHGLARVVLARAASGIDMPMPGFSHTRPAMPTTAAVWLAAFVEGLLEDAILVRAAYTLNDRSPLGSAAGFGSPVPLDRELACDLLGFESLQVNALACQNSRGKVEGAVLASLSAVQDTLAKLASDLILYSTDRFGFVRLPDELTTGSSIMPHKRNPDVLELVRARAGVVAGLAGQVGAVARGLGSGYHRDFQLLKEPLIQGLVAAEGSLVILREVIERIELDPAAMAAACQREIYAADVALDRARQGVPFRDAYHAAMAELDKVEIDGAFIAARIAAYQTIGSMGRPELERYTQPLNDLAVWVGDRRARIDRMEERLRGALG